MRVCECGSVYCVINTIFGFYRKQIVNQNGCILIIKYTCVPLPYFGWISFLSFFLLLLILLCGLCNGLKCEVAPRVNNIFVVAVVVAVDVAASVVIAISRITLNLKRIAVFICYVLRVWLVCFSCCLCMCFCVSVLCVVCCVLCVSTDIPPPSCPGESKPIWLTNQRETTCAHNLFHTTHDVHCDL